MKKVVMLLAVVFSLHVPFDSGNSEVILCCHDILPDVVDQRTY